jgi:hypothetical protein
MADFAPGKIGFGGVDGHYGRIALRMLAVGAAERYSNHSVGLPEGIPEMKKADVHQVVVSGDHHELQSGQAIEVLLRLTELGRVTLGREVAGDDDEVGMEVKDFIERVVEQLPLELGMPAVEVREVGDRQMMGLHWVRMIWTARDEWWREGGGEANGEGNGADLCAG